MELKKICMVILVIHSVQSEETNGYPPVNSLIEKLSVTLTASFADLRSFMEVDSLSKKILTTGIKLADENVNEILAKSKSDTEELVQNTSIVVDRIQKKITEDFVEYAKTPSIPYSIECLPNNYMFYFRSKAIKNGSYELHNCSGQAMPFSNDSLLDNITTNRQNSTVHVPTNVYDSSKEIQYVANYTQYVDETYALSENTPQIKWQFFCSNTGFFKIFPGIKWHIQIEDMEKDNTKVDFFDCRSEQWFLESTAYPKKMMIMVDKSGSMKGRRKIIANHTIYEILNTITENDYFNIILFTKDFIFVDNKTSDLLMQATEKNKRLIMDQLDINFQPDGIAEYDTGIKASFKVLQNEWSKENGSSIYNYLLMIITDGSPFNYQEVIAKENGNINARIFTYLIGQASSERDIVKQMACKNRGYAVEIATLADVKENVQKYLNVVARPNSIMNDAFFIWTGVHQYQMRPSQEIASSTVSVVSPPPFGMSSTMTFATNISQTTISPGATMNIQGNVSIIPSPIKPKIEIIKHEPIKMFVTVSKAAYDMSNETVQKNLGKLLGAVGVDVPISDFLKTVPFWKIGVNSYFFGVTHNGFVIFHPRFRPQDKKFVKYFYRNVDISELEVAVDQNITQIKADQTIESTLRDSIIDFSLGSSPKFIEKRSTFDIVDEYKTAFTIERNYYLAGIKETSYIFGLAVPTDQLVSQYPNSRFMDFNNINLSFFSEEFKNSSSSCSDSTALESQGGIALKNHELCNLNKRIAELVLQNHLCALREVLINSTLRTQCLLKRGTDVKDTDLEEYIKSIYFEAEDTQHLPKEWSEKKDKANEIGAQQIFSMHHFGLIRYFNYKNLSYENFISDHNAAIQDPLYQETVLTHQKLNIPNVLVVRPLPNDVVKKVSDESLLVFTATMPIMDTNNHYKGIIGLQVDQIHYRKILMTPMCNGNQCISCNNSVMFDCYVITGSGLVVLNNLNIGNTGEMLKEIDCKLMESMVNGGVFESQILYDFQDLCSIIPKTESFANILIDPFTKMFRFSLWFIYELFILIQNISLTSLLWVFTYQEETEYNAALPSASVDNGDMNIASLTTESVLKPMINLGPNVKQGDEMGSPGTKSKRQHEFFVKNTLEEKISYCKRNNQTGENEFSGCIQKAVTDICKLDKTHNGKQSDQHVEKLTSLNTISHCVTVCLILQSDYPTIWQEQDDCRQPNYMCRTVTPTYTSKLMPPVTIPSRETFAVSESEIINNVDRPSSDQVIKNGSMCGELCPSKTWYATAIGDTNLILVVVHKQNAACNCDCTNKFGLKDEIKRNISNSIENPRVRRPYYFHHFINFTKEENSTECSDDSSQSLNPLRSMVLIPTGLLVLMMW